MQPSQDRNGDNGTTPNSFAQRGMVAAQTGDQVGIAQGIEKLACIGWHLGRARLNRLLSGDGRSVEGAQYASGQAVSDSWQCQRRQRGYAERQAGVVWKRGHAEQSAAAFGIGFATRAGVVTRCAPWAFEIGRLRSDHLGKTLTLRDSLA